MIIRDAIVVDEGQKQPRSVLVYLKSGVLMVLNNEFQLIRSLRVSSESFARKPAPPLEIHQSHLNFDNEQGSVVVSVQSSDKVINLYSMEALRESKEKDSRPVSVFKDNLSNTIIDYQLMFDWRRALEENDQKIPDSILISTISLE